MFVCNREHYGYLPVPLQTQQTLVDETESFSHTLTEAMSESNDGEFQKFQQCKIFHKQISANVRTPFFLKKMKTNGKGFYMCTLS